MRPVLGRFFVSRNCSCIIARRMAMYCIRCGKENADDAVYCQKCGQAFQPEEETQVAVKDKPTMAGRDADGGETHRIFSITPTLKFVYLGYVAAVLGAFLVVGLVS